MAGKIQLTPGELQSQATEMQNLESEYSTLFAGVSSDLKSVNGNWSPNLSNNFEGKINSAQKSFTQITQELMNGSKVANTCAVTFESVDSELSKLYCEDTGEKSSNRLVEAFKETANIKEDMEDLQQFFDMVTNWIEDNGYKEEADALLNILKKIPGAEAIINIFPTVKSVIDDPSQWGKVCWNTLIFPVLDLYCVDEIIAIIPGLGDYYRKEGGLYEGLVNGVTDIYKEIKEHCDNNGGFFNAWINGWKTLF